MGWSIGYDSNWDRFIGYGVPAYCDHPDCNETIDRGLSHVCGGEPYGGDSCGLYFCGNHLYYNYEGVQVCERCKQGEESKNDDIETFDPKPEHPDWIKHILKDTTWKQWRNENKDKVKNFKRIIKGSKKC